MSKSTPRSAAKPRYILLIAAALSAVFAFALAIQPMRTAQAVSTGVVISQVYGGGGNAGATYRNDFIELFNRGGSPVSLNGWSVQYASSAGTTWAVTNLSNVTLQPGQYYLVQEALGAGGTTNLPAPDASGSIAMSATAGKVALVNSTTALTGTGCPFGGTIIDFVGFGGANCFEGAGPTATLSNTTAAIRGSGGCAETDNNNSDFSTGAPTPRNTASSLNPCGGSPTPTPSPSPPSGVGAANPSSVAPGNQSLLTVTVTPGTNPTSTGLSVTGDLSSIGGSGTQQFFDNGTNGDVTAGNNVFSFNATVSLATSPGAKSLPFTITDAQARNGGGNISLSVTAPPVTPGTVVISQIYGGGGNADAPYTHDYIEIFNRSGSAVDISGWSVQYASSTGNFSSGNRTNLSGIIQPGQYLLIREAAGSSCDDINNNPIPCGVALPAFDISGSINMSASNGKVALVSSTTVLPSGCPFPNGTIMDFVGYGTANCFEGAGAAPGTDNETADFRTHSGCKDTDSNGGNFISGAPAPRSSLSPTNICPAGDFPPEIFGTSPSANEAHIPLDSNITINFDEPVNVSGTWFQISCGTGPRTAVVSGGPISYTLNPDSDFGYNDPCTVTVFSALVTDQDGDDPPDNMAADYVFTFNSEFLRDPAEHMVMGNPSGATTNVADTTNFLMMKIQYALSYNDDRRIPNWTSWHLDSTWRGSAPRQNDFQEDTSLPPGYHQVQETDYSGSGFDRGHMCPSADRTSTVADNSATFLMTNMIPQAPGNNQGPWAAYEEYLRTFLPGSEIYIISGGTGTGGVGSISSANVLASGVTVPAVTWKVALILPVGDDDVARVDANTRTIAVIMPNNHAIGSDQWQKYLATVDQAEALSGYNFYSNVAPPTQDEFEAKLDAPNDTAPVTTDQNKTTAEDTDVAVTLAATDYNVNNTFTYTIVDQPLHGSVSCLAANCTYSPTTNYFGSDQFTFKANDGALDSNVSTVFVNVTEINNDPSAVNDNKQTAEDSSLNFAASDLTSNDSAGPNEGTQTLTVDSVISTPNTHGSIGLSAGQINYTPDANYNGPASFDYHFCDDGTTNGSADSKCTTGTVNVTVTPVNDTPTADSQTVSTGGNTPVAITLTGSDLETAPANLTFNVTSGPSNGTVSGTAPNLTYTPALNYCGSDSFKFTVTDTGDGSAAPVTSSEATVSITVDDTIGPTITLTGGSLTLSPPNHNYRTISMTDMVASASDHCDSNVDINDVVITKVTSDEADNVPGTDDGNTLNDIVIAADCKSVQLRAERNGSLDGRVYTVTLKVTDSSGNVTTATRQVTVQISPGSGAGVDSGTAYTVLSSCP